VLGITKQIRNYRMCSLHDVHKLNVQRGGRVCLPLLVSFNVKTAGHILMNFILEVLTKCYRAIWFSWKSA